MERELRELVERWQQQARSKFGSAEHEKDELAKRVLNHAATVATNCAMELEAILNAQPEVVYGSALEVEYSGEFGCCFGTAECPECLERVSVQAYSDNKCRCGFEWSITGDGAEGVRERKDATT